jgi:hypothetical protein
MGKGVGHSIVWIVAAFLVGMVLTKYVLPYMGGQVNHMLPLAFLIISLSYLGLGVVGLAAVLLLLAFCKRNWSRTARVVCVMPAALIIGMLVGFICPIFEPGAMTFLRGFERWTERNVDTIAIQRWMADANDNYWDSRHWYGKSYPAKEVIPEEFPDFLKDFNPQYLWLERSELDGTKIIRFEWGGALGHWGIVIGDPSMKMPELTEESYSKSVVEFRRILKPGVYVYGRG